MSSEKENLGIGLIDIVIKLGTVKKDLEKAEADKNQYWEWFKIEQKIVSELNLEANEKEIKKGEELLEITQKFSAKIEELEQEKIKFYSFLISIVEKSKKMGYKPENDLEQVKKIIELIEKNRV